MRTSVTFTLIVAILFICTANCMTQQSYSKDPPDFRKIMIGSHIRATLIKGDKNKILINHSNVEPEKLNIQLKGNTLKLYIDYSRMVPKMEIINEDGHKKKVEINRNVHVDVTVFYKNIE